MKQFNTTGIDFSYQDKPLRSAVDEQFCCWFVCEDVFDMLDVDKHQRALVAAANVALIVTADINFEPPLTAPCVNEAGLCFMLYALLDDDVSYPLLENIYSQVIRPIRHRVPLIQGRMPA